MSSEANESKELHVQLPRRDRTTLGHRVQYMCNLTHACKQLSKGGLEKVCKDVVNAK